MDSILLACIREDWTIYWGPGYHADVGLSSTAHPLHPLPSLVSKLDRRKRERLGKRDIMLTGEGVHGTSKHTTRKKAWPSVNNSILSSMHGPNRFGNNRTSLLCSPGMIMNTSLAKWSCRGEDAKEITFEEDP
jgi:hypothetical protein